MDRPAGVIAIALSAAVGLFGAFVLWARFPRAVAVGLLSCVGLVLGAGALLVQENPGPGDWVITLMALAVLTPAHCWAVFGPPGTHGRAP